MEKKSLLLIFLIIFVVSIPVFDSSTNFWGSEWYYERQSYDKTDILETQEKGTVFNCRGKNFEYNFNNLDDIMYMIEYRDENPIKKLSDFCPEDMNKIQEFPDVEVFSLTGSYAYEKNIIETFSSTEEEKQQKLSELTDKYNYDYTKLSGNNKINSIDLIDVGLKEVPFIKSDVSISLTFQIQDTNVLRGLEKYQGVPVGMNIIFDGNKITKSSYEYLKSNPKYKFFDRGHKEFDIDKIEVVEDDYQE